MGKEYPGRVRGLGLGPTPTQVFGVNAKRVGRVPLNSSNDISVSTLQQEVATLQSELQSSNDLQREMRGALSFLFQNFMGNVPAEFAHLLNPQVG